jgi:hypothetical protein
MSKPSAEPFSCPGGGVWRKGSKGERGGDQGLIFNQRISEFIKTSSFPLTEGNE